MMVGLFLSVPAVALLALATPRQASQLLGTSLDRRRRGQVRMMGWLLLAGSFLCQLTLEDLGRQVLLWVFWLGAVTAVGALILGLLARQPVTPQPRS